MKRRRRGTGTIERFTDRDGNERFRARVPREDGTREALGAYPTREAADIAIAAARSRAAVLVREGGITLRDFGREFLDRRELARLRGVKKERSRWRVCVDGSPLADLPMVGVSRADAKAWVRWIGTRRIRFKHAHPRNGQRMGRQSMQNALNLVRSAFGEALDDLGLKGNPFAGVKLPKSEGRTHDPWTYLLPEEQTRLLESLRPYPAKWRLVAFALFTGLRQAELYSLRWEDTTDANVTVRYGAEGKATKGGRLRRIPLLGLAGEALRTGKRKGPLCFPNRLGTRRFEGEPSWWKASLDAAGLGDPKKRHDGRTVRWHDLRHTCASSLVAGWWGRQWLLHEVQAMLGHASIMTTERYAHLAGSVLERAAKGTKYTPTLLDGPRELTS